MHASKRPRASPRLSDMPPSHTTSSTNEIRAQHQVRDQDQEVPPMFKASRMSDAHARDRALLCTLPPTCNPPLNKPTTIANSRDLEIHYGKYHAHVCELRGCGCVFPDARLLELVRMSICPRHRCRGCVADVDIFLLVIDSIRQSVTIHSLRYGKRGEKRSCVFLPVDPSQSRHLGRGTVVVVCLPSSFLSTSVLDT
jgi:hypothetical protein